MKAVQNSVWCTRGQGLWGRLLYAAALLYAAGLKTAQPDALMCQQMYTRWQGGSRNQPASNWAAVSATAQTRRDKCAPSDCVAGRTRSA